MSQGSESAITASGRELRDDEREIIRAMLASQHSGCGNLEDTLEASRVEDMQDGGMGSIRFIMPGQRTFGMALVEAQYCDSDGTPVIINLILDKEGRLFELEFWKVDFSPLKRYPRPSDLTVIK